MISCEITIKWFFNKKSLHENNNNNKMLLIIILLWYDDGRRTVKVSDGWKHENRIRLYFYYYIYILVNSKKQTITSSEQKASAGWLTHLFFTSDSSEMYVWCFYTSLIKRVAWIYPKLAVNLRCCRCIDIKDAG